MKKRRTAVITALILTFCLCFSTGSVYAQSLSKIQKEIKQKQAELDEGRKKEKNLSGEITDLEKKIYQLTDQITVSEEKLKVLKKELKAAQEKVDTQNEELGGRLRNMYKNGSVGFMDVLMNSNSFSEFLTNLDLVEKIYASDKDVLEALQDAHDEIARKKKKVEKLQAELKTSKAIASDEKAAVEEEKKKIAADNKKTAQMLDDLESEAEAIAAELAAKAAEGGTSSSGSSSYSGGAFAWPTPGYTAITSEYGWRICPFHGREFHGAIDIGASSGAPVVASAGGTVISAGWNGGFGNSVQIDHGGGLVTMYNHCSSIAVSAGQQVKRGQTVAYVGSTGSSTGPHLDYRVFKDGATQNPHSYL